MQKYRVSIVSYLNSLPFVYGLENYKTITENITLSKDIPSKGADKFINYKSDIALIPVGALPELTDYKIISNYCIGAIGKVDTVTLLSNLKLNEINEIYLDYQSRTSIKLIKILAKKFWNISPKWINANKSIDNEIRNITSALIIGDRAFKFKNYFKYKYDLAEEWNKYTGLPFAFAVWVAKKNINDGFISEFNKSLKFGIDNISNIQLPENPIIDKNVFIDYLTNKISFNLDENKRIAIALFLDLLKTI